MKRLLPALLVVAAACSARPVLPTSGPYAIGIETFPEADREKLQSVFDEATAMVELPETRVETRRDIFEFLLERLVFTAGVLRAQKLAVYRIWREKEDPPRQVRFDDTQGIVLAAELMRKEPERWVFYSHGTYNLGLFSVTGRSVIIVLHEERGGALFTQARVYAKVDGIVLEQGARLLGLVEGVIRRKAFVFIEAASAVATMAAAEPERISRECEGSAEVDPAELEEFRKLFAK